MRSIPISYTVKGSIEYYTYLVWIIAMRARLGFWYLVACLRCLGDNWAYIVELFELGQHSNKR